MSPWLALCLLIVAAVLANLPFVAEWRGCRLAVRALLLLALYGTTLGLSWLVEARMGPLWSQGWQFFAITAALFLILAFPGFVYRYLLLRRR